MYSSIAYFYCIAFSLWAYGLQVFDLGIKFHFDIAFLVFRVKYGVLRRTNAHCGARTYSTRQLTANDVQGQRVMDTTLKPSPPLSFSLKQTTCVRTLSGKTGNN